MSFLRSGRTNAATTPNYTNVAIQTSSEGLALPVIWGKNRLAPNLIWADNFRSHGSGGKGGGGKGGGKSSSNKTYSADVMLAICEGPVFGVQTVYINTSQETLGAAGLSMFLGDQAQTPWPAASPSAGYVPIAYRGVAYVAANNYDLGSSATVPQHAFEVVGFRAGTASATYADANPAEIILDLCTDTRYGLGMPASSIGDQTLYSTYCLSLNLLLSPALTEQEQAISILQRIAQLTNTWIFWSENLLKFVPLGMTEIIANGVQYNPVLTICYDLTYEDFVADSAAPPLTVTRGDPSDSYNWVKVEIRDRDNQYSSATIEYKDQTSIDKFGLLQANDVQASECCNRGIGGVIAGLIGARAVYVRNVYAFKLPYNFVLLEPGDIVTVNDPAMGLAAHPVRVRTIEEDEAGALAITAEECPFTTAQPPAAGVQSSAAVAPPSTDVDPGPVNPPVIVEPPASVSANAAQVWIGASGASAYWGGATVYLSVDDVTYVAMGSITAATPQGSLLNALPAHEDPDTTDTLAADFTESLMLLSSAVTDADADAGRTLTMVDGEVIGYGAVLPNAASSYAYDLTYLRRGFWGSPIAAHAVGAPVAAIQGNVLKIALPAAYVGQVLYLKLTSVNVFGQGAEDISTVTRYSYTPTGVAYTIAPPTAAALSISTPAGATSIALTLAWAGSPGPGLGSYEVQMSADAGATWTAADVVVGGSAASFVLAPATAGATYQGRVRAISGNGLAISGWAVSGTLNAGRGPATATLVQTAAPATLVATATT